MERILYPIEWPVAWILVQFHSLLSTFMNPDSGWTWVLSIVLLTVLIRILIIPLFVKQINSARNMQTVAPKVRQIQAKYKGKTDPASRQAMSEETMAAYRDAGANPLGSCLPALIQMPIFFALYRVLFVQLRDAAAGEPFGPLTTELAQSAINASWLFGATVNDSFLASQGIGPKIVTGLLIAIMCASTFLMQKELTMKNLPPESLEGPAGQTQKLMLYFLPFIYVISGPIMPIGVLVYWATTNLWSLGQQYYMVRTNPTPNSPWERKKEARINRRRERDGEPPIDFEAERKRKAAEERAQQEANRPPDVRVQPTGKKRSKAQGEKKLTDEEKLRRAREQRERTQAERRAQQPKQNSSGAPKSGSSAVNKGSKKRKKK